MDMGKGCVQVKITIGVNVPQKHNFPKVFQNKIDCDLFADFKVQHQTGHDDLKVF